MPRELSPSEIEDFRDKLCDAALQIFAEKGVEGLTMRDVANRLGISPMTPYRYFKDKDAILAAARARAFTQFAETMERAERKGNTAVDRSNAAGEAYIRFALKHRQAYRLMFDVPQADDAAHYPALAQAAARAHATMSHHIRELIDAGIFEGDPELIGYVFWAAIHGLVMLELSGRFTRRYSFRKVRDETFRALVQGFLSRSAANS